MTDQAITVRPNVQQVTVTSNAQQVSARFGPEGPRGPKGDPGPAGSPGVPGPKGDPGTTDYTQLTNAPALGQPGGVATLDTTGRVPAKQVPDVNLGGALGRAVNPVAWSDTTTYPIGTVDGYMYGRDSAGGSVLYRSADDGQTWAQIATNVPAHTMLRMGNGEMMGVAASGAYLSSGWTDTNPAAATWTVVATPTDDGVNPPAAFIQSDCAAWGQYVILGEYVNPKNNSRYVKLSTDNGQTFTNVFDLNTYYGPTYVDQTHIHAVGLDPYAGLAHPRLWFTHGDGLHGVYWSDDLGVTWNEFHGAPGSDWDPFDANAMSVNATPRGLVLSTDANVPDGVYTCLRDPGNNPSNWVIRRAATIPWADAAGSLLGFGERSWVDPDTGLVWVAFKVNLPATGGGALPTYLIVSDGERAEIAWTSPETVTSPAPDSIAILSIGKNSAGRIVFAYDVTKAGVTTDHVVELTHGGRGGRPYQDMNRGNTLLGYADNRAGVAAGFGATSWSRSVAIGSAAVGGTTLEGSTVAVGYGATGTLNSTAIGYTATVPDHGTAIGSAATCTGNESVAIGSGAQAAVNSVAIGRQAKTSLANSVAIGRLVQATAQAAVAIGSNTCSATGTNSVSIGGGDATADSAVAVGNFQAQATGTQSLALGAAAVAGTASYTVAIGPSATATNQGSVALGYQATTSANNQVAIGAKHWEVSAVTAPGNPAAGKARLFLRDNGGGKMQLAAIFPTGAVIPIVTEL